jgi:GNAT superfamily N-acetyltransferase
MSVSIRPARASDVDDIARLTAQLGYDVADSSLAQRLPGILARSEEQLVVAEIDGRVVGWLHAAASECVEEELFAVICGLVVDASLRRTGIGKMLITWAEEWARQRGCSVIRLWSSVGRKASHRFYEQMGYTIIKTQHAFAKSLLPAGRDDLKRLVPRIEE